jgi:hypothetical protein
MSARQGSLARDPRLIQLGVLGLLVACAPEQPDPGVQTGNTGNASAVTLPSVPQPAPPLDRATLLAAVAAAASAQAAGSDDAAAQRSLDGRPYEFRIRFGCRGPAKKLQRTALGWSFDAEDRTLRVRAMPTISMGDPVVGSVTAEPFEAVEGFWIPRPWLLQPVCPRAAATAAAPVAEANAKAPSTDQEPRPIPAAPRIGIAQFFRGTDSRTARRSSRAYEALITLPADQALGSQGFDLVLSGRLRALPERRVIACVTQTPDMPPDCIVSAEYDRVWVESPETGERIAEWSSS